MCCALSCVVCVVSFGAFVHVAFVLLFGFVLPCSVCVSLLCVPLCDPLGVWFVVVVCCVIASVFYAVVFVPPCYVCVCLCRYVLCVLFGFVFVVVCASLF